MAHSYHHAVSSAKRFGGDADEYLELHSFMDSSKAAWGDQRHRAVLHQSFGIYLTEQVFGLREEVRILRALLDRVPRWLLRLLRVRVPESTPVTLTLRSGRQVPIRLLAEQHVIEDCGFIPTLEQYLGEMPRQKWMYRGASPLSKLIEANQPMPDLVDPGVPTTSALDPLTPLSHV
jgi:hypothetical protein